MEKKYRGYSVISLGGKILGIGKNPILALNMAKKEMVNIEKKEFLVSRIYGDEIILPGMRL
ncbi:MAG: hypothetical protein AAB836_01685 [Patescibacteria group bacterium]